MGSGFAFGDQKKGDRLSEAELANLSLAVVAINGWNRLAIGFRSEVGAYQPGMFAAMMKET